jgi:zinc transporter 1/2/3
VNSSIRVIRRGDIVVPSNLPHFVFHTKGGFISTPAAPPAVSHSSPFQSLHSLPLWAVKIALQFLLSLLNIFCWMTPLRNKKFTQNTAILSLSNCFAGGIFLMLSFGHLIPEAMSAFSELGMKNGPQESLKFTLLGFLLMLFVEKVAFSTHIDEGELLEDEKNAVLEVVGPPPAALAVSPTIGTATSKGSFQLNSAIILCIAMSVHSFFESAALGLASDSSSAIMMAASVGLHQPAESIALLVAFLKGGISTRDTYLCLLAFSCVGLCGTVAGVLIKSVASQSVEAIVLAITAGTFIFVGATEVLYSYSKFILFGLHIFSLFVVTNQQIRWQH